MTVNFEALAAPFPPERVSWRIGQMAKNSETPKGKALAYLDARDVMNRLDEVCGPGGWQNRYSHADGRCVCEIGVMVSSPSFMASANGGGVQQIGEPQWVWKADGAGDTDIEGAKGGLSDAFKRAAVRWGIGRYLYDIPSPWVAVNQYKQIEQSEHEKLEALLKTHTDTIEWGGPEDRATLRAMANAVRSMVQTPDDVRRYRELNAGSMSLLRVKAREHINQILDQIEENAENQSA